MSADVMDGELLREWVTAAMLHWHVPGAAVAILDVNERVAIGAGLRDVQESAPMDEHTLFPIGSIAKSTSAVLADRVIAGSRGDWDTPLADFLPASARAGIDRLATVTLADAFSHQTGMASYQLLCESGSVTTRGELTERLPHLPAMLPPRTRFHYSNLMFLVACHAVEQHVGTEWDDLLTDLLCDRLKLADVCLGESQLARSANTALPHTASTTEASYLPTAYLPTATPPLPDVAAPAGTAWCSAHDMLTLMDLHLSGQASGERAITQARLERLRAGRVRHPRIGYPDAVSDLSYALGWVAARYRGERILFHGAEVGALSGFTALMPDHGMGVTVFSNVISRHSRRVNRCCFRCDIAFGILDRLRAQNTVTAWDHDPLPFDAHPVDAAHTHAAAPVTVREWGGHRLGAFGHPAFGDVVFYHTSCGDVGLRYGRLEFTLTWHRPFAVQAVCAHAPTLPVEILVRPAPGELAIALEPAADHFIFTRR